MKIKDFELYKSVYCSLCKCMGKKTGVISRLFLSYDATFLALITMAFKKECKGIKKGKCVVNPFKKCNFFISGEDKLAFAASVSSIMMYYKVLDDIKDSKGFKKLLAMVLFPIVKFSYSKSEKLYPEVKKIVYEGMQNQAEIENVNSSSIDESADPTARMMGKILPFLCEDEKQKKVLSQFGYFLGRWIYLIDALDDMEKDIKIKILILL